jgi:HEPN domain-containing protein
LTDEEFGEATVRQAMDLWINPEIERRKALGTLPVPFVLTKAQLVINVGAQSPSIRLNDEVRGILLASFVRPIGAGEPVTEADIDEIRDVHLTDDDGNAGHMTLLALQGSWFLAFDFRYNRKRIAATVGAADEFLLTAQEALEAGRLRAAVDNLFSATELGAKAILLSMPDDRVLTSKSHGFISSELNKRGRWSEENRRFAKLLNRLTDLRPKSRYDDAGPEVTGELLGEFMEVTKEMVERARLEGRQNEDIRT